MTPEPALTWDLVAAGRPQGRPVYDRPAPLPGPVLPLPYPGTLPLAGSEADVAAAAAGLDPLTAVTAVADGTLGMRRLEPRDLVGPHAATASVRGVRAARLTLTSAGHTAEYDPVRHAAAPAGAGFVPAGLRLEADVTRVPAGYAPVREVVGLLEAGMHHATAAWLMALLLPEWVRKGAAAVTPGRCPVSAWQAPGPAPAPAPRPAPASVPGPVWPFDPTRFARPFGALLGRTGVLDALCRRSAGRGPLGLAPARLPDPRGPHALTELLRAAAADLGLPVVTPGTGARGGAGRTTPEAAPLRLLPVAPAAVAAAFTYPADRVDAAACDVGFVLAARRNPAHAPAVVCGALLAAGACYQRLALAAGAHGYFLRPVRSVRAPELAASAGLRSDEAVLLTLLGGRSRYTELSLPVGAPFQPLATEGEGSLHGRLVATDGRGAWRGGGELDGSDRGGVRPR
ncbi:hypothetical protein [Streptomyces sp. NPDC048659]|uniref:hypothetical protein n=1 Tax=Streptomyces sp. NPDC048659 TaxID=3155489 RepID=UPI0034358422